MKFTFALLFTLAVVGSFLTGHASADCDQCPNYPTALSSLRIGDIIRNFVNVVVRAATQLLLGIFQQILPVCTIPVNALLSEYSASPYQTLRDFTEITLRLLNLTQFCYILNYLPEQIQNIPIYAGPLIEFLGPQLQNCNADATVPFLEWSQWIADFVTLTVTNDVVYYLNAIPAL